MSTHKLRQIYNIFGGNALIKINHHNDIALVTQMNVNMHLDHVKLNRGDIVFPVNSLLDDKHVKVLVPAGCDEEGAGKVSLTDLLPCLNPNVLPEERLADFIVTVKKGDNLC